MYIVNLYPDVLTLKEWMGVVLSRQHNEGGGQETAVWKCRIWQCKRHATPKSGLWLNSLLDVRALITHPTQGFVSFCYIGSVDICCIILYLNSCNIILEVGDGIVRLHPILGDLGCIPAHIKYMQLLHSTDTLCLLWNQFCTCYLQYSGAQF